MAPRPIRHARGVPIDHAFHAGRDMASGPHTFSTHTVALRTLHVRVGWGRSNRVPDSHAVAQLAAGDVVDLPCIRKDSKASG